MARLPEDDSLRNTMLTWEPLFYEVSSALPNPRASMSTAHADECLLQVFQRYKKGIHHADQVIDAFAGGGVNVCAFKNLVDDMEKQKNATRRPDPYAPRLDAFAIFARIKSAEEPEEVPEEPKNNSWFSNKPTPPAEPHLVWEGISITINYIYCVLARTIVEVM